MLYRVVRSINEWYPLVILWMYLGAFFLGFWLIFVLPQGTLLLLFIGLGGLGFAVIGSKLLHWTLRILARQSLRAERCPICESQAKIIVDPKPIDETRSISPFWECDACGASFERSGEEIRRSPGAVGNSHQDAVSF